MFFFFNDTATTEIYTLSLHDALPICGVAVRQARRRRGHPRQRGRARDEHARRGGPGGRRPGQLLRRRRRDRKSPRLNSSHANISYAVFCLKKKKTYSASTCTPRPSAT